MGMLDLILPLSAFTSIEPKKRTVKDWEKAELSREASYTCTSPEDWSNGFILLKHKIHVHNYLNARHHLTKQPSPKKDLTY